ncbi:MAG TPA: response regulator [Planctomycetota bacterium]|nr:response regulator [Planctomycetota bacterium]
MDGPSPGDVRPPSVLLVEDDSNDQMLLRRALARVAPRITLSVITDGHAAIRYLSEFTQSTPPDYLQKPFLVLLDVHLPRKSGWEVLRWIRGQVCLAAVPVALWTSLPNPEGIAKAREGGAERYFSKPQDLAGYLEIAAFISQHLGD